MSTLLIERDIAYLVNSHLPKSVFNQQIGSRWS